MYDGCCLHMNLLNFYKVQKCHFISVAEWVCYNEVSNWLKQGNFSIHENESTFFQSWQFGKDGKGINDGWNIFTHLKFTLSNLWFKKTIYFFQKLTKMTQSQSIMPAYKHYFIFPTIASSSIATTFCGLGDSTALSRRS